MLNFHELTKICMVSQAVCKVFLLYHNAEPDIMDLIQYVSYIFIFRLFIKLTIYQMWKPATSTWWCPFLAHHSYNLHPVSQIHWGIILCYLPRRSRVFNHHHREMQKLLQTKNFWMTLSTTTTTKAWWWWTGVVFFGLLGEGNTLVVGTTVSIDIWIAAMRHSSPTVAHVLLFCTYMTSLYHFAMHLTNFFYLVLIFCTYQISSYCFHQEKI